jgi:hypothetical protein
VINIFWDVLNWTGANNTSGNQYGFWSGFGSDLGEFALLGAFVTWWKAGECHIDGCHRRGHYPFQHYKLCKKHHPEVSNKLTHDQVIAIHKGQKGRK